MTRNKRLFIAGILVVLAFALVGVPDILKVFNPPEPIEPATEIEQELFSQVYPDADVFGVKRGAYPYHPAYATDPDNGENTLIGFVFLTTDVEPEERAYGGPIEILVGMTTNGVLTGIRVVKHTEPWGPFSIEEEAFAPQFVGKSVLDPFEVGRDIDAVTRVTITVDGAVRTIRKSARKIARQHLAE